MEHDHDGRVAPAATAALPARLLGTPPGRPCFRFAVLPFSGRSAGRADRTAAGSGPGVPTDGPRSRRRPARQLLVLLLVLVLGTTGCTVTRLLPQQPQNQPQGGSPTSSPAPCTPAPRSLLEPASGAWFGVSPDWSHDSLAAYADRLGHAPAVAVTFAGLPMSTREQQDVDDAAEQARGTGSMLLLTLEPRQGLARVTSAVAADLAATLARYNEDGVPAIVRLGHEMNGSWYPWGQDPEAYVRTFRLVASAVHRRAPGSAMMWAPNYGGGYPFAGGRYQAEPGSRAAKALDTDGNGELTLDDDPYAPYWPGRAAVDWVGMSLYHWGTKHPWGENEVPEPGKFADLLHGTYDGGGGDESAVPDFYRRYGVQNRLPVAVTETAALYVPGAGGADELAVKRAWWRQAFAASHDTSLPYLKMINWFEWDKYETEVRAKVSWTATRSARTLPRFQGDLPGWLHFADDVPRCR